MHLFSRYDMLEIIAPSETVHKVSDILRVARTTLVEHKLYKALLKSPVDFSQAKNDINAQFRGLKSVKTSDVQANSKVEQPWMQSVKTSDVPSTIWLLSTGVTRNIAVKDHPLAK